MSFDCLKMCTFYYLNLAQFNPLQQKESPSIAIISYYYVTTCYYFKNNV